MKIKELKFNKEVVVIDVDVGVAVFVVVVIAIVAIYCIVTSRKKRGMIDEEEHEPH